MGENLLNGPSSLEGLFDLKWLPRGPPRLGTVCACLVHNSGSTSETEHIQNLIPTLVLILNISRTRFRF